jgi:hypothetical protein
MSTFSVVRGGGAVLWLGWNHLTFTTFLLFDSSSVLYIYVCVVISRVSDYFVILEILAKRLSWGRNRNCLHDIMNEWFVKEFEDGVVVDGIWDAVGKNQKRDGYAPREVAIVSKSGRLFVCRARWMCDIWSSGNPPSRFCLRLPTVWSLVTPILDAQGLQSPASRTGLFSPLDWT